ncbi:MAG: hypothetical protein ACTSO9_02905 [Candidatus Helarchaeota archaeon]
MAKKDITPDQVLPFITTVVNDIYEKISELQTSLEKVGSIFIKINKNFIENTKNLSENLSEMLNETRMNRDLALEAFSDSMNALLAKIQEIQDEKSKIENIEEMQSLISKLDSLSEKLSQKYWDIQMMLTVSNLHTLIDILKGNPKVIHIPSAIPSPPSPQVVPPPTSSEAATQPQPTATTLSKGPQFKAGRKVKTHDDRLEEMRRKKKLFGKY